MKSKIKVTMVFALFCSIAYFSFANQEKDANINLKDIAIIQSAMAEQQSGNTGPSSQHTCNGSVIITCNYNEKWCDCENEYSCTEKLCPKHSK